MVKKTPRRKIQVSLKSLQQTMKEVFVLMQEQSITPRPKGHHLSEIERG